MKITDSLMEKRPARYRDERQAHFTTSVAIVDFMVSRMDPCVEDTIWEPAGGDGDLVDGLLRRVKDAKIHVSEIEPYTAERLKAKYRNNRSICVQNEDAVEAMDGTRFFSKIIANPPYGAWQSYDRRLKLKKRFPGLYVKDTYGVFLYQGFRLLRPGGTLVFILPDTFLSLNRHKFLRKTILNEGTVREIVLFPSKFFPGVCFWLFWHVYSNG